MSLSLRIIEKHKEDREVIKALKAKHAEELRVLEEFQSKRETALLETAGIEAFEYLTDLYVNGRDGKAATEKAKENIALNQAKIEAWLLKMLNTVGEGVRTSSGTVYKTRKESVSVSDFEMFVKCQMLPDVGQALEAEYGITDTRILDIIYNALHIELLNKAVNKTAILELMGDADKKDGSRPNSPPAGINYVAMATVGVRKGK